MGSGLGSGVGSDVSAGSGSGDTVTDSDTVGLLVGSGVGSGSTISILTDTGFVHAEYIGTLSLSALTWKLKFPTQSLKLKTLIR